MSRRVAPHPHLTALDRQTRAGALTLATAELALVITQQEASRGPTIERLPRRQASRSNLSSCSAKAIVAEGESKALEFKSGASCWGPPHLTVASRQMNC